MVKDSLTAASSTTLDLSETALESAVQATKLVKNIYPHCFITGNACFL